MSNVVYVAIPYSHEDDEIMQRRFEFVTAYSADIASEDTVPFSPITHSHLMAEKRDLPRTWDFWEEQDIPFLDMADELRVLDARGVSNSTGVQAETDYFDGRPEFIDPLKTPTCHIIGVSGKKRSGKDVLGRYLTDTHGYEQYAFADAIKSAAKEIFLLSDEQLDGDKKEEVDPYWQKTPRQILQAFGTDAFRQEFGQDVWVRNTLERMRLRLPQKAVITDVRFPNEVEAIQNVGGRVIRVDASERLDQSDEHSSETALDDYEGFDVRIENNGTLAEYKRKIQSVCNTLLQV